MFHIGQKIICIDDTGKELRLPWEILPVKGNIYHVRWTNGRLVLLAEIVNRKHCYIEGFGELRFAARRFRSIDERKTDISIFTKMLTDTKVSEPA